MDRFQLLLPKELKDKLVKEASKTGNSVAQIIRTAIVQYLDNNN